MSQAQEIIRQLQTPQAIGSPKLSPSISS
jgi:hypothetical protein